MTSFIVERLARAPLPKNTTQHVSLVTGSATGQIQVTQVACRLAAHFDEIIGATVSTRHHPNIFPAAIAEARGWRKIKPAIRYLKSLTPARPLGERGTVFLDARHIFPNNISHAMNQLIPSALAAEALSGEKVRLLMSPITMPRVSELLELFQVDFDTTGRSMEGRTVELYAARGLALYNAQTYFDISAHTLFRELVQLSDRVPKNQERSPDRTHIYISRRGARALKNAASVERLLQRHGYEPVYMEDYSVEEQCRIGAGAERVVAIHGAGMGFLALNKGLRSVIEILPPNVYHQFFPTLLADSVQEYVQIMPQFDYAVAITGWDEIARRKVQPFSLDEALLERALVCGANPGRPIDSPKAPPNVDC
jgi:capsular polysaccharide biosynthesis protein